LNNVQKPSNSEFDGRVMVRTYLGLVKVDRRYWVHSKDNAHDSRLHLAFDLTACTIIDNRTV